MLLFQYRFMVTSFRVLGRLTLVTAAFLLIFPLCLCALTEPDAQGQMAYVKYFEERLKTAVIGITGTDKVIVVIKAEVVRDGRSGRNDVLKTKEKSGRKAELLPGVPQKKQYTIEQSTVLSGEFQGKSGANYLIRVASATILIDKRVPEDRIAEVRSVASRMLGRGAENIDIHLIDVRKNFLIPSVFEKPQFYWMAAILMAGLFLAVIAYFMSTALMKLSSSVSGRLDITQNLEGKEGRRQEEGGEAEATEAGSKALAEAKQDGPFSFIRAQDIPSLAYLLMERPAAEVAIVANFLRPELALKLLQKFPAEKKAEIIVTLSEMKEFDPDTVSGISDALNERLKRAVRGEDKVASLLGLAGEELRETVFALIEQKDNGATARLRKKVKSIEDLFEEMSPQDIQRIFRSVGVSSLAQVVREFPEDIQKKVLDSLTEKAAERFRQEMELSRPLPAARLMEEKIEMFAFIHRMAETGALELSPPGEG